MATVATITTPRYRRITVEKLSTGSPRLGVASTSSDAETIHALLTPHEARQIIDALEPMAAPPRTALDTFSDFPLGQVFTWSDDTQRVKVSKTHYAVLGDYDGEPTTFRARAALATCPADAIEAIS